VPLNHHYFSALLSLHPRASRIFRQSPPPPFRVYTPFNIKVHQPRPPPIAFVLRKRRALVADSLRPPLSFCRNCRCCSSPGSTWTSSTACVTFGALRSANKPKGCRPRYPDPLFPNLLPLRRFPLLYPLVTYAISRVLLNNNRCELLPSLSNQPSCFPSPPRSFDGDVSNSFPPLPFLLLQAPSLKLSLPSHFVGQRGYEKIVIDPMDVFLNTAD